MRRWITQLMLGALTSVSAMAVSGSGDASNRPKMWSEIDPIDVAPRLAERLSAGPVAPDLQTQLLLLSEDERLTLRGFLLEQMSEEDIEARPDIFAIVGYPEGTLIDAETVNESGQEQAAESGFDSGGGAIDGWQLYVDIPRFYSQGDPNWSSKGLGYNYCGNSTIGRYGCHLTCVSMLYGKWGYPEMNPPGLNNWSFLGQSHYAFVNYKNTKDSDHGGCGDFINPSQALQYPNICRPWSTISTNDIYGQLQRGRPVIANTDQYGFGNHFVVIFAFDGAKYWVKDPVKDWVNQDQPLSGNVKSVRLYGYFK